MATKELLKEVKTFYEGFDAAAEIYMAAIEQAAKEFPEARPAVLRIYDLLREEFKATNEMVKDAQRKFAAKHGLAFKD